MAPDNKLGITNPADIAREEERISKKKALLLFDKRILGTLKQANSLHSKPFISTSLMRFMTLLANLEPSILQRAISALRL